MNWHIVLFILALIPVDGLHIIRLQFHSNRHTSIMRNSVDAVEASAEDTRGAEGIQDARQSTLIDKLVDFETNPAGSASLSLPGFARAAALVRSVRERLSQSGITTSNSSGGDEGSEKLKTASEGDIPVQRHGELILDLDSALQQLQAASEEAVATSAELADLMQAKAEFSAARTEELDHMEQVSNENQLLRGAEDRATAAEEQLTAARAHSEAAQAAAAAELALIEAKRSAQAADFAMAEGELRAEINRIREKANAESAVFKADLDAQAAELTEARTALAAQSQAAAANEAGLRSTAAQAQAAFSLERRDLLTAVDQLNVDGRSNQLAWQESMQALQATLTTTEKRAADEAKTLNDQLFSARQRIELNQKEAQAKDAELATTRQEAAATQAQLEDSVEGLKSQVGKLEADRADFRVLVKLLRSAVALHAANLRKLAVKNIRQEVVALCSELAAAPLSSQNELWGHWVDESNW